MFSILLNTPSSFYAFVSGVFITISTTAIGEIILSASPPTNTNLLIAVGIITFFASVFWIYLSEIILKTNNLIEKNAATVNAKSWERRSIAMNTVKKDKSLKIYVIFIITICLSLAWIVVYLIF